MFYLEITPKDGESKRIPLPDLMTFPEMQGGARARVIQGAEKAAIVYQTDEGYEEIWAYSQPEWLWEKLKNEHQVKAYAAEIKRIAERSTKPWANA